MKFFHGRMKTIIKVLFILFSVQSFAEDMGQYMPDQAGSDLIDKTLRKYKEQDKDSLVDKMKVKGSSYFLPEKSKDAKPEEANDFGLSHTPLDSLGNKSSIVEFSNKEILRKVKNKSTSSYSFSYVKDTYEYSDPDGIFEKTFETPSQGDKSHKYGYLHLGMDKYISKGKMNWGYGFNLGLGFNNGTGRFVNSTEESRASFRLWVIPIDLYFTGEVPMGDYFKWSISAGPSVAGLWQNRSDRDYGEDQKSRRQVSWGFSGNTKLMFSMAYFMPKVGFKMYSDYQVSQFYLNLILRFQSYENFQDPLTIGGASAGLGFTFEYL